MGIRKYMENIDEQMSGEEIAKELGVTRQAVSNILKKAMDKMLTGIMKETGLGAFESASALAEFLQVDEDDYNNFFRLFPPKTRKTIEDDAKSRMKGKK